MQFFSARATHGRKSGKSNCVAEGGWTNGLPQKTREKVITGLQVKGKSHIRALSTASEREAKRFKKDAEAQLDRIKRGRSPAASRLLADGFSITDVLFGSPEVATRLEAYHLDPAAGSDAEVVKTRISQGK